MNMVARLFHAPLSDGQQAVGTATIGSSEAIMLAGDMRWDEMRGTHPGSLKSGWSLRRLIGMRPLRPLLDRDRFADHGSMQGALLTATVLSAFATEH